VRAAYGQLVAGWLARGRRSPSTPPSPDGGAEAGPTVDVLLAAFRKHAEGHYRYPGGKPTNELSDYRLSLRPLRHLYGALPVSEFSPLEKAVRELMVNGYEHPKYGPQAALSRGVVNQHVGRIVRAFKWGVAEEVVAVEVYQALKAAPGLQKGRSKPRETRPVEPVPLGVVERTLPHLTSPLQPVGQQEDEGPAFAGLPEEGQAAAQGGGLLHPRRVRAGHLSRLRAERNPPLAPAPATPHPRHGGPQALRPGGGAGVVGPRPGARDRVVRGA
jgi:hypothetical protein